MSITDNKLKRIEKLLDQGLDYNNMQRIMVIIGAGQYSSEEIAEWKLYSDYVPMADINPRTEEQRYLQILWETIDRVPLSINCAFSIPFRAMIAKRLFKKCGDGFIAYERIILNLPHLIEVGDNVAWNCGCIIDSKGGVTFGHNTMLAENVTIFSHSHDEDNHVNRQYKHTTIGNHVILGSNSTVLAGVTMHDGSYAAAGSVVTKDVDENIVVSGAPAKPSRKARRNGKTLEECNLFFFKDNAFQSKP